jgi:hypothetical protein
LSPPPNPDDSLSSSNELAFGTSPSYPTPTTDEHLSGAIHVGAFLIKHSTKSGNAHAFVVYSYAPYATLPQWPVAFGYYAMLPTLCFLNGQSPFATIPMLPKRCFLNGQSPFATIRILPMRCFLQCKAKRWLATTTTTKSALQKIHTRCYSSRSLVIFFFTFIYIERLASVELLEMWPPLI